MYSNSQFPIPDSTQLNNNEYDSPVSADGTLVVMVIRAKHLPNRRKLDKQSPYVVARIGVEARKTEASFRAGQTPEWNHEMRFQLSREKKSILKIDVLDETKGDPTPIGNTEIDATIVFTEPDKIENGKYIHDKWFALNFGDRQAGLLYLEMTFYPSTPVLPPKIPIHHENVVVINESDYDPLRSSTRSSTPSKFKNLPMAPFSASPSTSPERQESRSQNQPYSQPEPNPNPTPNPNPKPSVTDDVFVSSENSTNSKSSSLLSRKFFKNNQNNGTNNTNSYRQVFINESTSPENSKGYKKYTSKLSKLTDKFQSKQPFSNLWRDTHESVTISGNNTSKVFSPSNMKRSVSPLSDYGSNDLDQLRQDISGSQDHGMISDEDHDDLYNSFPLSNAEVDSVPPPPPHLITSNQTMSTRQPESVSASALASASSSASKSNLSRSPRRKPPPSTEDDLDYSNLRSNMYLATHTSVPFSADSIGADHNDNNEINISPTQVYMLGQKVKSSTTSSDNSSSSKINNDEIDPKFYAPSPSDHLNKYQRLLTGGATSKDLGIDLRTSETGYIGNGSFSPTIFERAVRHNYDDVSDVDYNDFNKPEVPPKIPMGLSEKEYYILEREKYLQDMKGNRT